MSKGHATSIDHGNSAKPGMLRRPRRPSHSTACQIDARLETSPATSERLLDALNAGMRDFVLTSVDGRLSARVRLTLANVTMTEHTLADGNVVVDWSESTVAQGPRRVSLSRTELRLFAALLDAAGRPLSRAALIERIWPDDARPIAVRENALAVYVCCLRKRLNAVGVGQSLRTLRGVGYQVAVGD
jgi:DNA-binding response OmpR family regulator